MNFLRALSLSFMVLALCESTQAFRRKDFMERCPLVSGSMLNKKKSSKPSRITGQTNEELPTGENDGLLACGAILLEHGRNSGI